MNIKPCKNCIFAEHKECSSKIGCVADINNDYKILLASRTPNKTLQRAMCIIQSGITFCFTPKELSEYRDKYMNTICNEIESAIAYETFVSGQLTYKEVEIAIKKVKENIYGLR